MANIEAFHLENTTSRNAYWRAYIITPASGRPFWIAHWGALGSDGNFVVHHDGYGSASEALAKRNQKAFDRGYSQAAHHTWTLADGLADRLATKTGRHGAVGPFWELMREFSTVIAGGEPLDDIFAALREMISDLSD